jgi:dolichol-phosphate mannosyltransferase
MLSAVIPVFNEAESLPQLFGELCDVARANGYELEVIFVDDGSTDASWSVIRSLAAGDSRARGIRFRRNFGKAAALQAGFQAARGEKVMTLDADLQDDPREIPAFLAALEGSAPGQQGGAASAAGAPLDVVSGWKKIRHDPWHKVGPSRVFNWLVSRLTGVKLHDHNCGMKCYRREVLAEVRLYGELHRFIPVLAAARGFRVGELAIGHRPRQFGRSKYGMIRFVRGFLDLLTVKFVVGFGHRPQHLLGAVGLVFFAIGAAGLIYLAEYWVERQLSHDPNLPPLHERPAMLYALGALLVGSQFFSIGLLAELIAARQAREEDVYSIAERIGPDPPDETSPHERSPTRQ